MNLLELQEIMNSLDIKSFDIEQDSWMETAIESMTDEEFEEYIKDKPSIAPVNVTSDWKQITPINVITVDGFSITINKQIMFRVKSLDKITPEFLSNKLASVQNPTAEMYEKAAHLVCERQTSAKEKYKDFPTIVECE